MLIKEFFEFMRKREQIRINRESGVPREQWTDDPILQKYKFTNVKREHDRTTRELMDGFYSGHNDAPPAQRLVNCAMARYFGRSSTVIEFGWRTDWSPDGQQDLRARIEARMTRREKIFTGAYIIPNCGMMEDKYIIVLGILRQIADWSYTSGWWRPDLTFREFVKGLCFNVVGVGSFMAKEVILDFILSSGWTPPDWQTWTPIGPGARRGAARVVSEDGRLVSPLSEAKGLEVAKDLYDAYRQTAIPGIPKPDLWPEDWVKLDLADIQFQLCEFDKYMRAKLGQGKPKSLFVPHKGE